MNNAKIRIKVGSMELDYEGDPSFLTGGIEALLTTMGELSNRQVDLLPALEENIDGKQPSPQITTDISTNTIAARVGAKSGSDLVLCAIAQHTLIQGKLIATRNNILAEMKNATTYYKTSMSGNLTGYLRSLVKANKINESGNDRYALTAAERKSIEAKIANNE